MALVSNGGPSGRFVLDEERMKAAAAVSPVFTYTVPDFPGGTDIIGLCALPANLMKKFVWLAIDYLSFKGLLYRVGTGPTSQTWMSTVDFEKLESEGLQFIREGKNVGEAIKTEPQSEVDIDASSMRIKFLYEVTRRAAAAKNGTKVLVIIVCGLTTPEQDICLDPDYGVFITKQEIRQAVQLGGGTDVTVTYIAPSTFTAGWQVLPALCGELSDELTKDHLITIVAKCVGSTFADRALSLLASVETTPFLTEDERAVAPFPQLKLPTNPTPEQQAAYDRFHQVVHVTLQRRLSDAPMHHSFQLVKDDWVDQCGFRSGTVFEFWCLKWSTVADADTPKEPSVAADAYSFLGGAFGGTHESQVDYIKFLASLELATCPGDWSIPANKKLKDKLVQFVQGESTGIEENHVKEIYDVLEFRASAMLLAEILATYLDVPFPERQSVRFLNDRVKSKETTATWDVMMPNLKCTVLTPPDQTPDNLSKYWFYRPARWLADAIVRKHGADSLQNCYSTAKQALLVVKALQDAQIALLADAVRTLGVDYLTKAGKRGPGVDPKFVSANGARLPESRHGPVAASRLSALAPSFHPRDTGVASAATSPVAVETPTKAAETAEEENTRALGNVEDKGVEVGGGGRSRRDYWTEERMDKVKW